MPIELIKKQGFEVQVIRTSRRKTTCIQINHGVVTIRVPKKLASDKIESLVNSRDQWIKEKLDQQQKLLPIKPKQYISGESVYYLGKRYQLQIGVATKESAKLINGCLQVKVKRDQPDMVRKALKKWYIDHAKQHIQIKVERWSVLMKTAPKSIQVREYKARWGSCNIKGDVKFNWKLIMASSEVIDYVVVHELCHLIEHNHSARFWKLVKSILPEYEIQRLWLRENGHHLEL